MRNYLIAVVALIFASTVSANTSSITLPKNSEVKVMTLGIDCNALYNSTYNYMILRKYPIKVAEATAAAASNACFDEVEAASGTNPDCKPVTIGIIKP